jgi:hypothetical protein
MELRRFHYVCLALVVLLGTVQLRADVTGSILGQVRDASGAVVPNASVTVTQTVTGYARTVMSDSSGQYSFLALPPGRYRLTTSSPGFQQGVIDNIDVNVNDVLQFDVHLKVGNVSTLVTVEANAVQIQTVNTALGNTIEASQILAMPLNGRSYLDLLALQPGVAPANTNGGYNDRSPASGLYGSSGNVSTDGQPEWANAFLVNGAEVNETKNMGAGLIPDADSIAEFRLLTNSFNAEYGKFTGAVMNTVTKSGTNRLHGTLFEFYRSQGMNANDYITHTRAELKRNQFGGVLGGPIWRDHIFFFTDYQGTRQVAGVSTGIVSVLSADERNGIFPDSLLTNSVQGAAWASTLMSRGGGTIVPGVTAYNQLGTAVTTTDANGNSVPGHNISAYIDPVSALTLPLIPQANQGVNGYSDSSHKGSIIDSNMSQRIDFVNRKTGDWSFYYHYDDATAVEPVYSNNGAQNLPGFPVTVPSRNQLFVMSNSKTFGTSAANVARISFFRTAVRTAQPSSSSTISSYAKYGFNTDPTTGGLINTGTPGYPSSLPALFFNSFAIGNNWLNLYQPDTNYTVGDTFSKILGKHSFSFGGDFRYYQLNARNECGSNGYFNFFGNETGGDVSDYYIGAPNQFVQCSIQLLDNRTRYFALFGEDSWKMAPNLTVNYGLRWDVARPWSDVFGRLTSPVPGEQSVRFPNSPPGNLVPGDPGVPKTISPTRWNNFAPRLGIAYSPSSSEGFLGKLVGGPGATSIRAAFGIYYLGVADNGNFGIIGDAPWGLYWASPQPTEFASPYITRSNGVTQGQHFPFTFPSGSGPFPNFQFGSLMPLYVPGYYNKNKTMNAEHYNISIQRQLDQKTVLTVAYVGTQGHHIEHGEDVLWGSSTLCMSLPGCGPGGEGGVYMLNGQTYYGSFTGAVNNQAISANYHNSSGGPVVAFASATYLQNSANSNYNSLQASVERRASDVTFLFSYTYAKSLDDQAAKWDPRSPNRAYGLSSFDMRHNFVMSYNWNLPFDRAFGARRITQGWHLTGISRFNTGVPISLQSGGDLAETNIGLDYPTQVGPIRKLNPHVSVNSARFYFDKSAFASNLPNCSGVPNSYETCGVTGSAKQFLFNGPGSINTDAGIEKDTKITESIAFNMRFEMFNVFNHANFLASSVVGNANSGQFGQVTQTAPTRVGQISAKLIF